MSTSSPCPSGLLSSDTSTSEQQSTGTPYSLRNRCLKCKGNNNKRCTCVAVPVSPTGKRGRQENTNSTLVSKMPNKRSHHAGVRILPQSMLDKDIVPQEPPQAPPRPDQIVSLLVLGEPKSGKSALIQRFLVHEVVTNESSTDPHTRHDQNKSMPKWDVAYHKRDIVFCKNNSNSLKSMRVQIWDTSGVSPTLPMDPEWETVWKRSSCVLLTLSLQDSIDTICSKIQEWTRWIHNQCQKKPIVLMLHQSDQLLWNSPTNNPLEWMEFGKIITELCFSLQIQSWHITSAACPDDDSVDKAFRDILGRWKNLPGGIVVPSSSVSTATTLPTLTPDKKDVDGSVMRAVSPLT